MNKIKQEVNMDTNMKYSFHFMVKYNGKWHEGVYGKATRAELKAYIRDYFPAGDGRERALLDMRTLRVLSKVVEYN